jgi:hypothetical protein
MLAAYTQVTAADLLRALGTDRDPADDRVVQAARTAGEQVHPGLRRRAPSRV